MVALRSGVLGVLGLVFAVACSSNGDDEGALTVPQPDASRTDVAVSPDTSTGPSGDSGTPSSADASDTGRDAAPAVDARTPPPDAATVDAGRDAAVTVDSAPPRPDAGRDASAPLCSPPASTPPFTPGTVWTAIAPWKQNRCSFGNVTDFLDACLGPTSSLALCNSWKAANAACSACLLTPRTAAAVGPFVVNPSATPDSGNPAGLEADWSTALVSTCLSHFSVGCGPAVISFDRCVDAACDRRASGNCSTASETEYRACRSSSYASATSVCYQPRQDALGTTGACNGVFPQDAGTGANGYDCFDRGAAQGEDTSTQFGRDNYQRRLALYFCGP